MPSDEVEEFAEQMAATLAAAGFPRMAARVMMAIMTAESGRATAEELSQQLGASAAAISGATRYLQSMAIIRRLSIPGTRRHRYELPDHAWYDATSSQGQLYTHLIDLAERGLTAMQPDSKTAQRTAEMADYFRFMRERLPLLLEEWKATRR
ncbi:MarR family transcriptional regulator [Lacisediminihabitans sp.]|jgi:DNA-binding transcriptional regulator GbsR (MarR family)|uniref:GbsR/MarR family transcriptional regulator n=1 Tax=Lacisediminihabitans sp. TaxID=2787631 RepID=UPI002F9271A9